MWDWRRSRNLVFWRCVRSAPGPQGRANRPPSTISPGVGRRRRPIDGLSIDRADSYVAERLTSANGPRPAPAAPSPPEGPIKGTCRCGTAGSAPRSCRAARSGWHRRSGSRPGWVGPRRPGAERARQVPQVCDLRRWVGAGRPRTCDRAIMSRFSAVQRIGPTVVVAGQVGCPVRLVASCLAGCA